MERNTRALLGGGAIGAAGVLLFALGLHLSPNAYNGRNLVAARLPASIGSLTGTSSRDISSGGLLSTASTSADLKIANSHVAERQNVGPLDDAYTLDPSGNSPGSTFQEVYVLLRQNFVDGVPDDTKLAHGAASAMLASLQDPVSRFMEPAEMSELNSNSHGLYHGIGAVTVVIKLSHPADSASGSPAYDENRLTIVAPLPNSPAEKSGLKSYDVITRINGRWIATYDPVAANAKELKAAQTDPVAFKAIADKLQSEMDKAYSLTQAETELSTPSEKTLLLTISRPGSSALLNVSLDVSSPTQVAAVTSKSLGGGIGYIKLNLINPDTDVDFQNALSGLGSGLTGLVLDLRNCPGGDVEAAARIAGRISNAGSLGLLSLKDKKYVPITISSPTPVGYPIAVLVNSGTANSAELLTSALDQGGAKIVGQRTFGDATAVRTIALRDGSGFTITIGHLYTNNKNDFARTGLQPDLLVDSSNDALASALTILHGKISDSVDKKS